MDSQMTSGTDMSNERWHVDKTISIANILVVFGMCIAGFGAYDTITDRMAILETNMTNLNSRVISLIERQTNTDQQQDNSINQFRTEMRSDVLSIQDKLDRLIERELGR